MRHTIQSLIDELEARKAQHGGDLPVAVWEGYGDCLNFDVEITHSEGFNNDPEHLLITNGNG